MLLLLLIVIVLSIPAVQTAIANKVTTNVNETYGTDIHIDRLGLNWKGEVDLRGILVLDHHGDTLIYSEELQTNILSVKKLIDGAPEFGFVEMTNSKFYIKTYRGELEDNLDIFLQKLETDEPSEKEFILRSDLVTLKNTHFKVVDENLESPVAVDFSNINLDASDFLVKGPDVSAQIRSLNFDAARGFSITELNADFTYTQEAITMNNLLLETLDSYIKGVIVLKYGEEGLADFENNVTIDARLEESKISTNDLNALYNEFGNNIDINLEGSFVGTLNDFRFTEGQLAFGNSRLFGNYHFQNLLDEEKIYILSGSNHTISSNYFDLKRIMPRILGSEIPQELKAFGNFSLKGNSRLEDDLLTTNSSITSAVGSAETNMKLGNIHDFANAFYNGTISLKNFNLGKIAGTSSLGAMDADLFIDGRGFTTATVNTIIKGRISSFNFEGYTYKNIDIAGNLKDPVFNGNLKIDDPNLKMDFSGLVDISKDFNQYDFEADIEFAELNKLRLFTRDSIAVFAGRIVMDMQGTNVDDAVGTIEFFETFYQTEEDDFFFDDFLVSSFFTEDIRTIEIKSPDMVDGRISGKFLVEDIPNLFHNSVGSIYANYIPNEVTTDQYIDYEFEIFNKLVEVFVPQLQLGENTRVKGSVYSDESKFKLDFRSPELLLYDNYLGKVNIQLDNDNPLFNAYVSVDSLYTGTYNLSDIDIINKTLNDTLYIQSNFKGGKEMNDLFNMRLYHTINPKGKSVVGIKRSKITYQSYDWYLNRNNNKHNKLTFDNNFRDIVLDSLTLRHEDELIKMAGVIRDSTFTDMRLDFTNVDIGKLVPQVDSLNLKGSINGRLNVRQRKELTILILRS